MGKKVTVADHTADCENCKQRVTFRVSQISFTSDEGILAGRPVVDKILSYGSCGVARNAKIPNHPIHNEMTACPLYSEMK